MTITINRLPGYGEPIVLDVETLVGADLTGANLIGAKLRGADLRRVRLHEADLHGADLTGADLTGADLNGADLSLAVLTGANLTGANLRGADLRYANLRHANLSEADLYKAKICNDTLSSLLTRAGRSDGYEFLAFRLEDGSTKIMAGCRWLTPDEYRAHVDKEYPDTPKAEETLAIIEFIERMAGIREGMQ